MRYGLLLVVPLLLLVFLGCDGESTDGDADGDADSEGCGEVGQACNESLDCPALQVCHDHHCGCAFDRNYEIEIINAGVYARAPGGYCWEDDPPSCADFPDVYAIMEVEGRDPYRTETIQDSFAPIWNESFEVFIDRHTTYGIWLYDEDPGEESDDIVLEFGIEWGFFFTEENLRNAWMFIEQGDEGTRTRVDWILTPL